MPDSERASLKPSVCDFWRKLPPFSFRTVHLNLRVHKFLVWRINGLTFNLIIIFYHSLFNIHPYVNKYRLPILHLLLFFLNIYIPINLENQPKPRIIESHLKFTISSVTNEKSHHRTIIPWRQFNTRTKSCRSLSRHQAASSRTCIRAAISLIIPQFAQPRARVLHSVSSIFPFSQPASQPTSNAYTYP